MVRCTNLVVILVALVLIQSVLVNGFKRSRPLEKLSKHLKENELEAESDTKEFLKENELEIESDTKVQKRSRAAAVIPVIELSLQVMKTLLDALGSVKRKIAIGIANKTPYVWKATGVYFFSGLSNTVLPASVNPKEALLYPATKTNGPTATGVVGVLCYNIPQEYVSLCVMFSVPYDYNWYYNWWDVQVLRGKKVPSKQLYQDMYYGSPYKGDNRYQEKSLRYGFKLVEGIMTSGGAAKLKMTIKTT